jgi:hypothetical protein
MERSNRIAGGHRVAAGRLLVLSILAASAAACGPTKSTAVIMDADVQLTAAKTAGAEKLAPYDYTAASQYLHKAREEQGYSDYEEAIDFAEKARSHATVAKQKAMVAKNNGAVPLGSPTVLPLPPAPEQEPVPASNP